MNKVVRKIEISAKLDAAVQRIAKDTKRSLSEIVADAVEHMLSGSEDTAIDLERWAEYERTGVSIDIEDARKRLKKKIKVATPHGRHGVKVRLLPKAYDDIDRLESFLLPKNPDAAERVVDLLFDSAKSLGATPGKGRPVDRVFRDLVVRFGRGAYIMRYRVDQAKRIVLVTRAWHAREHR